MVPFESTRRYVSPVLIAGTIAAPSAVYAQEAQPAETPDARAARLMQESGLKFPEGFSPRGAVRIGRSIALAREGGYLLARGIFPSDERIVAGIKEMDRDGDGDVDGDEWVRADLSPGHILVQNQGNIGHTPDKCRTTTHSDFITNRDFQLYQDLQRYRLEDFLLERIRSGMNQYRTSPPEIAAWETKAYEATGDLSLLEAKLASLGTQGSVMTRHEYDFYMARDCFEETRDHLAGQKEIYEEARANPGFRSKLRIDLGEFAQKISREEQELNGARIAFERFKEEPTHLTEEDWEWLKLKEFTARQEEYWGSLTRDRASLLGNKLHMLDVEMKRCLGVTADF